MMNDIRAVLFDLDGTLCDTAPDLIFALNQLRGEYGLAQLEYNLLKPLVSFGSKSLLKSALNIDEHDERFSTMRDKFFNLYLQHLTDTSRYFAGIENVLAHLHEIQIPWGIVTNKLTLHTHALLKKLASGYEPACVICGDTLALSKPDPAPILHACTLLDVSPQQCIYIGDSENDVIASKAAGMRAVVALYGYIDPQIDPKTWQADAYIHNPIDILNWLSHV